MIPPVAPSKKRRACVCKTNHGYIRRHSRKTCYNPSDPRRDLTDLICDLGAETVLAAHIIRQAADDLKDARAGKVFKVGQYPWYADPLGELCVFFGSAWFVRLAAGIGQDPADLLRIIQSPITSSAAAPAD